MGWADVAAYHSQYTMNNSDLLLVYLCLYGWLHCICILKKTWGNSRTQNEFHANYVSQSNVISKLVLLEDMFMLEGSDFLFINMHVFCWRVYDFG